MIDDAAPINELETMTQAQMDPKLSLDDLQMILQNAQRADANGRSPSDVNWQPTYDLNAAAAEGWRLKAAKVAGDFNFRSPDGSSYDRSQVMEHCERMAKHYASRIIVNVQARGPLAGRYAAE
jgi:hypothetical protein